MSEIKLHYFATKGIGEPVRLLLAAGEIEFADVRNTLEQFTNDEAFKKRLPFGQVPALEVDGVLIAQKDSIGRYAAKLAGLYPADPLEAARVDMIVVFCNDVLAETTKMVFEGVPGAAGTGLVPSEKRDRLLAGWRKERMPGHVDRLEQLAGDLAMIGSTMTWADVCVFNFFDRLRDLFPDLSPQEWPKLEAVCARVAAHPRIDQWMREHPRDYPPR